MMVHWIWFATRPSINERVKVHLLQQFGDPEAVYFAADSVYDGIDGLSLDGKTALQDKNLREAEEILQKCQRDGIQILTYQDAAYPNRLKNIPDPPVVLYYLGRLPDFDGAPLIGVVGTRKASAYGLGVAKRMGYQIARCGGIVVSGMAYGIDGLAMAGALTAGAPVVGVLGCGADIVYPPSNRGLFADTRQYGCILTEFAPGTPPAAWNFPKRNRIISGLSCGVLVVEAPEKSGALITAQQAADQGRDVFVVPGNIDVDSCIGSNRLLRDGAIAVSSGWDILSEYEALFPDKIRRETTPVRLAGYGDEVAAVEREMTRKTQKVAQNPRTPLKKAEKKQKCNQKVIDNGAVSPYIDLDNRLQSLSPDEQTIVSCVAAGEQLVDDVIAKTGLPAGKVLAALTMLEVKGILQRLPGKRVMLKRES